MLRPDLDNYFMGIAVAAASRAECVGYEVGSRRSSGPHRLERRSLANGELQS